MKTKRFLLLIILAMLISGPGCKKMDLDPNELTLSADLSIFKTIVNFTYIDAVTGELLVVPTSTKLKIEVIAPTDKLIVNTGSGEYQNTFSSNYAATSFALNPYAEIPTPENPIKLLVRTSLDKYLENVMTITISDERNYNQAIRMVNLGELPEGVIIEDHQDIGTTTTTGETKEPIQVNTGLGEVKLTIAAGTTLKDGEGKPLSGKVSVNIMSVDVSMGKGINNVPSLLQPLRTENGKTSSLFNPIAYTRVDIRDQVGKKAKSVTGKDLIIVTGVNPLIINTKTRMPITVGDIVPSYYLDSKDGSWKFFGHDTVSVIEGKLQLIKVIKSLKSTGDEDFSEITYSFDEESPIDLQLQINLPSLKPVLPTTFTAIVKGIDSNGTQTVLFDNEVTLFTRSTAFTINNLSSDYVSYLVNLTGIEMLSASGMSLQKAIPEITAGQNTFTFNFTESQFKDPVTSDGPTRLYLQFSCIPTSGNPLFMDSPNLPNSFYLIFSGTGFTGETILQIQGGSFIVPFNPMLKSGGQWQAKVVMGSMEYPSGSGRVSVTNADFQNVDGRIIFRYTPETAEGCDDFKAALGI
jgi:hypothetical protein